MWEFFCGGDFQMEAVHKVIVWIFLRHLITLQLPVTSGLGFENIHLDLIQNVSRKSDQFGLLVH